MFLNILVVCLISKLTSANPDGAPPPSCKHMLPGHVSEPGLHGIPIQHQRKETSPYTINAKWDESDRYVRLTITGAEFKGFLIQARLSEDGEAVGSFNIDEFSNETKYQNCTDEFDKFNSRASITHADRSNKQNVSILWEPPRTTNGSITFYATIAQSFDTFWLKLPSNTIDLPEFTITTTPTPTSDVTQPFNRQLTHSLVLTLLFVSLFTLL